MNWLKEMITPVQMHLSEELEEVFGNTITAWDNQETVRARTLLQQGIELAKQLGWR